MQDERKEGVKQDVHQDNQVQDEECEMEDSKPSPEERFIELFGQPPREAQKNLLSKLVDLESNVLLLNLHTGVGKSCLGTFFGRQNPNDKLLYICSNKTLQHQIVSECKHKFPNVGNSFVLYGKGNYFCTERVEEFLKDFDNMRERKSIEKSKIHELAHDFSDSSLSIYKFLETLKLDALKAGALDFSASMEDTYRMKKLLSEDCFERVWKCICCTSCKNRGKKKNNCLPCCLHRRAYDTWKESDVRIINSYTFFTVANIHEMIFEKYILDNVTRIVMDEAHMLENVASSYIVAPSLPSKPFTVKELHEFWKLCTSRKVPLFQGHIVLEALERDFRMKKNDAKFLLMKNQECKRYISVSVDTKDYNVKLVKEQVKTFLFELKKMKHKHEWNKFFEESTDDDNEFVDEDDDIGDKIFTSQKAQQLYENYLKDARRSIPIQHKSACLSLLKDFATHIDFILPQVGKFASMISDETTRFSFSEVMKNVQLIIKWVDRVTLLSSCMNAQIWTTSEWKYIVPSVSFEPDADTVLFSFDCTWQFAAEKFKEKIWERISIPVVLMSASVQNVLDKTDPYALFLNNIGLETNMVQKYTSPHVFDVKRNLKIYWPDNDVWFNKMEYHRKRELQVIIIGNVCDFAQKNPRCTLIISKKDDMRYIMASVKKKLRNFIVANFEDEPNVFEKYPENNRIVLFGSDKMCQGLNKPGRIGGMLICRNLNFPYQLHLNSYMSIYLNDMSYGDRYTFLRLNREYQAIGRILRCESDFGCFGLLSHSPDEVDKLQRYFAPQLLDIFRDSPVWPEDPAKEEDVEVTGERSWEERDAELRSQAVVID